LKPDGIIAVHISNAYLCLAPVITRVAESLGMKTTRIISEEDGFDESTDYIMVTNQESFLRAHPPELPVDKEPEIAAPWTDLRHNLFDILMLK
jgi:hypothetical protein